MPLVGNLAFAIYLIQLPALMLLITLRRDVGIRLLNPLMLIATFGGLSLLAIQAMPGNEAARPQDLLIFAGIGFLSGITQRILRWWDLHRGVLHHTYFIGTSPFQRWLPKFLRSKRFARILDSLFAVAIGYAIFPYSPSLGTWLVISGICLRAWEEVIYHRERSRELDLMDSAYVADEQARSLEHYEQGQNPSVPAANAPVMTGIGEDIQEQIRQRRANTAKKRK